MCSPRVFSWLLPDPEKKNINSIYSILPFEKNYFMGEGIDINYIGNPLVRRIKKNKLKKTDNYIAVWEGAKLSRKEATNISGIKTVLWTDDFKLLLMFELRIPLSVVKYI